MKTTKQTLIDPICGMEVDPDNAAAIVERDGEKFYFCSTHCRDKFESPNEQTSEPAHSCCQGEHHSAAETKSAAAAHKPASKYFCPMCEGVESDTPGSCPKCGMALERNPTFRAPVIYTCPMHPQIEQDHPGNCPICGMTLEPKNAVAGGEEDNSELRDMTRRLWIGAALSLPVFVLAMSHLLPSTPEWVQGDISRWVQFLLATPVVLWAGWPFFKRGWQSIVNRSLNMFTLIAIGVGAAYFYSAVVMLFPQLFPPSFAAHGNVGVYFESAAIIIVLVLFGQVLELRARSRTGSAIRALLDLARDFTHRAVALRLRLRRRAHHPFLMTSVASHSRARGAPCSLGYSVTLSRKTNECIATPKREIAFGHLDQAGERPIFRRQ